MGAVLLGGRDRRSPCVPFTLVGLRANRPGPGECLPPGPGED